MLTDHPPRPLRKMVNVALAGLSREFEAIYSQTGRPSTLPPNCSLTLTSTLFSTACYGLVGSLYSRSIQELPYTVTNFCLLPYR